MIEAHKLLSIKNFSVYIHYDSSKEMGKIYLKDDFNNLCFLEDYLLDESKYKTFKNVYEKFSIWNKEYCLIHYSGKNILQKLLFFLFISINFNYIK
jgi:hypothetical protein